MDYKIKKVQSNKYKCGVCDRQIPAYSKVLVTGYSKVSYYEHANTAKIHLQCTGLMIHKLTQIIKEKNILFDNYKNEVL